MHLKSKNKKLSTIQFFFIKPFDEIAETVLSIKNTGKVTIKYAMIRANFESATSDIEPDKPVICPSECLIEADRIQSITIKYLPGIPRRFTKKLQIQVSHFAPEEITIEGEASFADIMLDLPRHENDTYQAMRKEARSVVKQTEPQLDMELLDIAPEIHLQVEIDRLAIENYVKSYTATRVLPKSAAQSIITISNTTTEFNEALGGSGEDANLKRMLNDPMQPSSAKSVSSVRTINSFKKKMKITLPDYILDFGHVILGTVKTHVVRAANMGKILASFEIERQNFSRTGFHTYLFIYFLFD